MNTYKKRGEGGCYGYLFIAVQFPVAVNSLTIK